MKKFIKYIVVFLLPFFAGIILLFVIPVDKKFSYRFVKGECDDKASWIYHRVFEDERNIDIVFSGASQTGSAIMDERIENELSRFTGTRIHAVNFGYCRRGRDVQYVMLKDLFQHKNPEILVVEVYEDEPKKSHPVFPYLAGTSELFNSFVLFNQRFPGSILKGIVVRFEYMKTRFFNLKYELRQNFPAFGYRPSQIIAETEWLDENQNNWRNRLNKTIPALLRRTELNYSKHYLEKIIELAAQNNCEVLFLYLPESGSHLKYPLINDYYRQLADVVYIPDSIINNKTYWKDATHFNDSGAEQVSEIIVSKLKDFY